MRPTSIAANARDSRNCQPVTEWSDQVGLGVQGMVTTTRTVIAELVQRIIAENHYTAFEDLTGRPRIFGTVVR